MPDPKLWTLVKYQKMTPREQGYVHYMQANWPGSELAGTENPYEAGTPECVAWNGGQLQATLDVMDGEE